MNEFKDYVAKGQTKGAWQEEDLPTNLCLVELVNTVELLFRERISPRNVYLQILAKLIQNSAFFIQTQVLA